MTKPEDQTPSDYSDMMAGMSEAGLLNYIWDHLDNKKPGMIACVRELRARISN